MQMFKYRTQAVRSRNNIKRKSDEDNTDEEWTPGWNPIIKQEDESGNDCDKTKCNECPACHRSFSRSAALICHIKQNHRYMLQNGTGEEPTLAFLREEVMKWKNKQTDKKIHLNSDEIAKISGSEKDSGNESSHKSSESNYQEELNNTGIIGGSVSSPNKPGFSILSFEDANDDLLDPDQSFSIVRQSSRNNKAKPASKKTTPINDRRMKIREKKKPMGKKDILTKEIKLPITENSISPLPSKTATPVSLDLSIDSSPEDLKKLECYVCHSHFSNSKLLTYHHMKNHMTHDCHQCPVCGCVFFDQMSFSQHCKLHRKTAKSQLKKSI